MAHTIQLRKTRDGSTYRTLDIDDKETDNAAGIYKVHRASISTPAPEVLSHVPDVGDAHIVNWKEGDRLAVLEMSVFAYSSDYDAATNAVIELRRWGREAFNQELDGATWPIELYTKRQSTTNATIHYVKGGWVDDSASYLRGDTVAQTVVWDITFNLWLSPYGVAESAITLQNDMLSSPHAVEDTDDDGDADGWLIDGLGHSSASIGTSNWLIGGQCQAFNVTADAENQEIKSPKAVATVTNPVVGYLWIATNSAANDPVYIQLRDGGGTLANGTGVAEIEFDPASPAGYDKKITSAPAGSLTWYRYVVTDDGTGNAAAGRGAVDVKLWVRRKSADTGQIGIYRIDGAYLEVNGANGTTAPDGWMSARNIDNRGDILITSEATMNYLNYWDIWGIPGDAPALVKTKFDWTTTAASQNLMYVGKISDGDLLAADEIYWIEDSELTTDVANNGAWSVVSAGDAVGRTADRYRRFTDGGAGGGEASIGITLTGADALAFIHNPKRLFGLFRCSSTATTFYLYVYSSSSSKTYWRSFDGDLSSLDNAAQWTYFDSGTINLRGLFPISVDDAANFSITIKLAIIMVTASATFDIDAQLLLPTEEQILITTPLGIDFNPNTINTYIDGRYKHAVNSDAPLAMARQGTLWTIEPGAIMSRNIWAVQEIDQTNLDLEGNHDPTIAAALVLSIWPRTRHLLGT